jgi:U3 small nucleolar RNA-associated protein 6
MSEKVFLNLERMMPELEDYEERGVFTKNELLKIVETRKKHEFRLQRVDKKLMDFIKYIQSETSLEKIRDKRLKKHNLKNTH